MRNVLESKRSVIAIGLEDKELLKFTEKSALDVKTEVPLGMQRNILIWLEH